MRGGRAGAPGSERTPTGVGDGPALKGSGEGTDAGDGADGTDGTDAGDGADQPARTGPSRRRRGSRGGRGRGRTGTGTGEAGESDGPDDDGGDRDGDDGALTAEADGPAATPTAPAVPTGATPGPVSRPKIGDTRPAPPGSVEAAPRAADPAARSGNGRSGGRGRSGNGRSGNGGGGNGGGGNGGRQAQGGGRSGGQRRDGGSDRTGSADDEVEVITERMPSAADAGTGPARTGNRRGGRERRGKAVGRYMMCVHVRPETTQIALLEGRTLVEHYVSHASDDATQIDGNIYRGRVQNVLPGMEAAFIDIGTPKNAVLYRGDVRYDTEDLEAGASASQPRIEQVLRPGQTILCQVTKNPIGAKGARLTQEVSLPGRFVVLVPDSTAFGISKRLDDTERKRLRKIVDAVRPKGHGLIVRTAAAGASADELRHDVERLVERWEAISAAAAKGQGAALLYKEPPIAVRVIREELNREYRAVVIDDLELYEQVHDYVGAVNPELADRVEYFDTTEEPLPVFERYHVHEQLHKALDRKVYLPSGGSLVIDRTEALTVIDVNTGKNVGTSNLEETVYRNNLEAAEEVARQLRLRDIGGIIVIDFIDMEIRGNRDKVSSALRAALARDKTRTQVFDISELGLVEMTRKRVSEGLIESLSTTCEVCEGRGIVFSDPEL